MKKIKLLIILLLPVLLLTGCNSNELDKSIKNTSISKVKSYRLKADIVSSKKNINYIVLNENNKVYSISIFMDNGTYKYDLGKDDSVREIPPEGYEKYDFNYTNTDKYLNALKGANIVKSSKEKINEEEYTKYEFKINKKYMNDILKDFSIKTNKDGEGYVYVDKDNHIYLVNYTNKDISITASYTRLNNVK